MKFLISACDLPQSGGIARYVFSLCQILSKDNEVWVLTTHNEADISFETKELNKISSNIKLISLGSKNKFTKYLSTLYWIRKIHPDFLINNYNAVIQYILPLVQKDIKVVHVLHNDTDDFYRVGSINAKRVFRWIAPTSGIAERFNVYTNNKYSNKTCVISHGVETGLNIIKSAGRLELIFVGVLYEHKGVKLLPQIIKELNNNKINFHFTIVGTGYLEGWLKKEFKNEIKEGRVTMKGVLSHPEVYELMALSHIFLYPTHIDAFGLVIAEAMMNGAVPVVSHLSGVTDNLIDDNTNGFLIQWDNVQGFVDSICKIANDRYLLNTLSQKAVAKANARLSFDRMRNNYLNFFNQLNNE